MKFISTKKAEKLDKIRNILKKVSNLEKKVLAPLPILKLDLDFGSRYGNLVSVAYYLPENFYLHVRRNMPDI